MQVPSNFSGAFFLFNVTVVGEKRISSLRFGLRPTEGLTVRSGLNGGSASKVEVSKRYSHVEAENPRHSFLRWGGLQRRLDWKCASPAQLFVKSLKVNSRV